MTVEAAVFRNRDLTLLDPWIEDVLALHERALGRDLEGYRGHVYRVFNFAWALTGYGSGARSLALAAAFHDLGIWADGTFDYLAPSAVRAATYAREKAPSVDERELERLILWHHRLRAFSSGSDGLVEAFRRADWIDVTWGLVRFGLPRELLRDAHAAFPNAGFHRCLLRVGLGWAARHPLRPLPVLRW
jgi:hypothetical protein